MHISVGLNDMDDIVNVTNWLRMDMPLFLALTAASPYRNGVDTGYHSSRWIDFPQEPVDMRFFDDHADFVRFVEDGLASGKMRSLRHMWSAVRPNGQDRPYDLNRIETRICDLVFDPALLLAVTAVLEARIIQLQLKGGKPADHLLPIARENERRVAKNSLNATVWHYGKEVPVRVAIARLIGEVEGIMCASSAPTTTWPPSNSGLLLEPGRPARPRRDHARRVRAQEGGAARPTLTPR